jgi:RHS repeat-associated protein
MRRLTSVRCTFVLILGIALVFSTSLTAQSYLTSTGSPSFASNIPVELGYVDLSNGNLHLEIPLATFAQRGKLALNERLVYDSRIWQIVNNGTSNVWAPTNVPNSQAGWRFVTGMESGTVTHHFTHTKCSLQSGGGTYNDYINFVWTAPDGSSHMFPIDTENGDGSGCGANLPDDTEYASDSSGYVMAVTNFTQATVYGPDGTRIYPCCEDTNGNYFSTDASGNLVDTLGRTPVTSSASGNVTTYTVLAPQNTTAQFTVSTGSISVSTDFSQAGVTPYSGTLTAVTKVQLPDGSSYSFGYDSDGELNSITLRTGGQATFGYTNFTDAYYDENRWVSSRTSPGGTWSYTPSVISYCASGAQNCQQQVAVSRPSGDSFVSVFTMNGGAWNGQTQYKDGSGNVVLTATKTYNLSNTCSQCTGAAYVQTVTDGSQLPNGSATQTQYTYSNIYTSNITAVQEWGYNSGSFPSLPDRETDVTYAAPVNACNGGSISNLPSSIVIKGLSGGSQYAAAQTNYSYDGSALSPTSSVAQHDYTSCPSGTSNRGNVTQISRWIAASNWANTTRGFDDTGNVVTITDGNSNATNISYSNANAYVNQITQPSTASPNVASHTTQAAYDPNTGLLASTTDQNNQQTTYTYDSMLRPLQITYPDGGWTQYSYASATTVETKRRLDTANNVIDQYLYFDSFGRQNTTVLVDPEGNDSSETTYDANGRVESVTNPHRAVGAATDGTTQFNYDALDRVTKAIEQDGNTITYSYSNNIVTSSDEAGHQRQSTYDGFGNLTQMIEPNPATGSLTTGQLTTNYAYDVLGNVISINQLGDRSQSARVRAFGYDSLSRLTSVTLPESGTTTYHYDSNGNVTLIQDPRNITTSITYDQLNRPRTKTYSDGTPSVTMSYDETSPWGISGANNTNGRLSSTMVGANLAGAAYIYDSMGRLVRNDQCGKSICGTSSYPVNASYNLAGHLTSLTYPSGRKIVNSYSTAGNLIKANYDSYNGTAVNYAYYTVPQGGASTPSSWGYWPAGMLQQFIFAPGDSETISANNRLQMTQITANGLTQTVLSKTYAFVSPNNGNIAQINDNLNSGRTQNFSYDFLDRLAGASTSATSGPDAWSETYNIDPWGNAKQTGNPGYTLAANFGSNNQIAPNQGYTYDSAGNLLTDTFHAYAYDAEGRMTTVDNSSGIYTYAADGSRSRKDVPGDYAEYVYFGGQGIAEKNSAGDWTDYIYANGERIVKAEGLNRDLHIYGNTTGSGQYALFYFGNAGGLNGYTIQSGDKLQFTQYQETGSKGGMVLAFTDGSNSGWGVKDQNGYYLNDDQVQNNTHLRTIDLSSLAGKTINNVALNDESDTAAGAWNIYFDYVSLLSADGTVHPLYTGQTSSPIGSIAGTSGETGIGSTIDTNRGKAIYPTDTTTYYVADHLGSSRMILSGNGYPVWSGVFLPFGQEWNPQITMNTYKFTGWERDSESNLDHSWFRQYEATEGRWLSPDPYLGSMNLSDPQTLNRYAYVGNRPCIGNDPLGLDTCTFNVRINNKAGLTESQLQTIESRINAVLGSAQSDEDSVQAQFEFSGKADFNLNISPSKGLRGGEGWSGWALVPLGSPTVYWGSIKGYTNAATYAGTDAAHELVHRGAGPRQDLFGSYNGVPNLMNVNFAQDAGVNTATNWENPDKVEGFATINSTQAAKLYKKCTKAHPPSRTGSGAGGPGRGGEPSTINIVTVCTDLGGAEGDGFCFQTPVLWGGGEPFGPPFTW